MSEKRKITVDGKIKPKFVNIRYNYPTGTFHSACLQNEGGAGSKRLKVLMPNAKIQMTKDKTQSPINHESTKEEMYFQEEKFSGVENCEAS